MAEIKKNVLIFSGIFLTLWGIFTLIFVPTYCNCPVYTQVSENCWVPLIGMINPIYYMFQFLSISTGRIIVIFIGIYLLYKGIRR
jgi:uncharacterized membrane protein